MPSQADIANHLDLTQPAVSQMIAAGVLPRPHPGHGPDLENYRVTYIRHLRERAAGRASAAAESEGLDLVQERARLARAQADAQEMRNRLVSGETIMFDEVERILGAILDATRARLLALPTQAATELVGITSQAVMRDRLTRLIHQALDDLASTEFETDGQGGLRIVQPKPVRKH